VAPASVADDLGMTSDPPADRPSPDSVARPVVSGRLAALVAVGGAVGTLARYFVESAWTHDPHGVPWATLVINLSGAALLVGFLTLLATRVRPIHRTAELRAALGTGLLGGWTTMSTLAVETVLLVDGGDDSVALAYVAATIIGSIVVGLTARTVVRNLMVEREPNPEPAP
jgi:CrcB protein